MTERPEVPVHGSNPTADHAPSRWWSRGRWVLAGATLLILGQLTTRIWVVSERFLYADDLLHTSQGTAMDLFSGQYLFEYRGGHLVPGALILAGSLARLAPLEWWPEATATIVLQLMASLAVLRLLRALMGDRPALLVPLTAYLFSTLSVGAFTWWAAAMQSIPLQIGLAWVAADAVKLLRSGRRRYAVTGSFALALTLAFYEKAVLVPVLAFALVAVLLNAEGVMTPVREAWRRCRPLWLGLLPVLALWAWVFRAAVPSEYVDSATVGQVGRAVRLMAYHLLPALVGGPSGWGLSGVPIALSGEALYRFGGTALAALVAWSLWRRRGAAALWGMAGAFVLGSAFLVALGRASSSYVDLLPLSYRYYSAEAVLVAIVLAVLVVLPARTATRAENGRGVQFRRAIAPLVAYLSGNRAVRVGRRVVIPVLTILFVAGTMASTVDHVRAWKGDPTQDYITTALASLAAAGDSPLLDQEVPSEILWGYGEYGHISRVFAPLTDRPSFSDSTDQLRMLDPSGKLRPAQVSDVRQVQPGPLADCGWGVQPGGSTNVQLTSGVFHWAWTVELNYLASRDGVVSITLGIGQPVRVPVERGLHTVFVRLWGDGGELTITPETQDLGVCIDSGTLGNIELR